MNESEFQRLIQLSHERRGDKASKYSLLEPALADIQALVNADVALTVIRDWLEEKQNIKVVLNTLRKFVVSQIGRETYDLYLRRNGWAKSVRKTGAGNAMKLLSTDVNYRPAVQADKLLSVNSSPVSQPERQTMNSALQKTYVDEVEMMDHFREITRLGNQVK
jgi:hypothetical protein